MIGSSRRTMPMGSRKNRPMPNMREKARVEARIQPGMFWPSGLFCWGSAAARSADIWRVFYAEDEGF